LACKYVLLQFGQGNFPSASFAGIAAFLGDPFAFSGATVARPGALGSIPLLPCEPTTCVRVSSLGDSAGRFGIASALVHIWERLSPWLKLVDNGVNSVDRGGAGAIRVG
jgi:hypothetical protein